MHRLLRYFLLAISIQADFLMAQPACIGGPLHLRIISTMGEPAVRLHLTLINLLSKQVIERSVGAEKTRAPTVLTLSEIPCGKYLLKVRAPMLDTRGTGTEVSVTSGEQSLTLAYPFDKPVDHYGAAPSVDLVGTVKSGGKVPHDAWVKLVGVYTNDLREAQVDNQGRFSFVKLAEGAYVVILTLPYAEPVLSTARLTAGVNRMELSAP